ncbi:hypothetical protein [Kribbella swartbergensis]
MTSTPQIPGYRFDHQLLTHPLAEVWRGRSFTGMEVVALVLSDAGARDAVVCDRLVKAGRDAALEPGQDDAPLWAANFSSDRPYAITQLIPGRSGAERLIDPLDGILGNDEDLLRTARSQLSQYGAAPPPADTAFPTYAAQPHSADQPRSAAQPHNPAQPRTAAQPQSATHPQARPQQTAPKPSKVEIARQYRHKIGGWIYLVAVVGVLIVFSITYSIGSAIGSSVKDEPVEAVPAAVSPGPLPSPALLPGVEPVTTAKYKPSTGVAGVLGAAYPPGADVQPILTAGLPFAFGWPRPPDVSSLGESSTAIYRRVRTAAMKDRPRGTLEARIALHPCRDLAGCLADREAFDRAWSTAFKVPAPATAKDARTWFTEEKAGQKSSYALTMSRTFMSGGRWWLVGVAGTGVAGEEQDVQRIVNDIWWQTS